MAASLSYRVVTRRHCLILLKSRSTKLRAGYRYGLKQIASLRFRNSAPVWLLSGRSGHSKNGQMSRMTQSRHPAPPGVRAVSFVLPRLDRDYPLRCDAGSNSAPGSNWSIHVAATGELVTAAFARRVNGGRLPSATPFMGYWSALSSTCSPRALRAARSARRLSSQPVAISGTEESRRSV